MHYDTHSISLFEKYKSKTSVQHSMDCGNLPPVHQTRTEPDIAIKNISLRLQTSALLSHTMLNERSVSSFNIYIKKFVWLGSANRLISRERC